jgi:hypothetical protein
VGQGAAPTHTRLAGQELRSSAPNRSHNYPSVFVPLPYFVGPETKAVTTSCTILLVDETHLHNTERLWRRNNLSEGSYLHQVPRTTCLDGVAAEKLLFADPLFLRCYWHGVSHAPQTPPPVPSPAQRKPYPAIRKRGPLHMQACNKVSSQNSKSSVKEPYKSNPTITLRHWMNPGF